MHCNKVSGEPGLGLGKKVAQNSVPNVVSLLCAETPNDRNKNATTAILASQCRNLSICFMFLPFFIVFQSFYLNNSTEPTFFMGFRGDDLVR